MTDENAVDEAARILEEEPPPTEEALAIFGEKLVASVDRLSTTFVRAVAVLAGFLVAAGLVVGVLAWRTGTRADDVIESNAGLSDAVAELAEAQSREAFSDLREGIFDNFVIGAFCANEPAPDEPPDRTSEEATALSSLCALESLFTDEDVVAVLCVVPNDPRRPDLDREIIESIERLCSSRGETE